MLRTIMIIALVVWMLARIGELIRLNPPIVRESGALRIRASALAKPQVPLEGNFVH